MTNLAGSKRQVMIVSGEASGDMHGAHLIAELRRADPTLTFFGMGGEAMRAAGVEIIYDAANLAVVGILEVLAHLRDIRAALTLLTERMRQEQPVLLILIDYPDFNFILAKRAKKLKIPVFYYISPQVWAWRSGRVGKIKRLVDKMAVILPFEQAFYARRGCPVHFVGHPLLDAVRQSMGKEEFLAKHHIPPATTLIGILPGSRRKEIESILPTFLQTARLLAQEKKGLVFLLPLAPSLDAAQLRAHLPTENGLEIRLIGEDRHDLMAACDLVMAASGTVTLELAILGIPMVVAYRISPLTYFLGRRLIKIQYASLVNLVAEQELVRELLQDDFTPSNLRQALLAIWPGQEAHRLVKTQLASLCLKLGQPGAARRTAALALELIATKS